MKVTLPRAIMLSLAAHAALLGWIDSRLLQAGRVPSGEPLPEAVVELLLLAEDGSREAAPGSAATAAARSADAAAVQARWPAGRLGSAREAVRRGAKASRVSRRTGEESRRARAGKAPASVTSGDQWSLSCARCARPEYPLRARRNGWAGKVEVAVEVDPEGVPQKADILASSGYQALDRAAARAALRSRFRPQRDAGVPVAARGRIVYQFELRR